MSKLRSSLLRCAPLAALFAVGLVACTTPVEEDAESGVSSLITKRIPRDPPRDPMRDPGMQMVQAPSWSKTCSTASGTLLPAAAFYVTTVSGTCADIPSSLDGRWSLAEVFPGSGTGMCRATWTPGFQDFGADFLALERSAKIVSVDRSLLSGAVLMLPGSPSRIQLEPDCERAPTLLEGFSGSHLASFDPTFPFPFEQGCPACSGVVGAGKVYVVLPPDEVNKAAVYLTVPLQDGTLVRGKYAPRGAQIGAVDLPVSAANVATGTIVSVVTSHY